MLRISFLLLCPIIFLSCAAMEEQAREQACNREYGYEKGTNDAVEGQPMNSGFAAICEPSVRKSVMTAYREGYEAERNRSSIDVSGDGLRIKIPGVNINTNGRSWRCEINVFGKQYVGYGTSRAQASSDSRRLCEQDNNAVHCGHGINCKEER